MNPQSYCTTNRPYCFPKKHTAGSLLLGALLSTSWLHATGVPVQLRHQPMPAVQAGTSAAVDFTQLNPQQLEAEAQRLERDPRLQQLSLRGCQEARDAVVDLLERVGGLSRPNPPSPLQTLDLEGSQLTPEGLKQLLRTLSDCPSLTALNMGQHPALGQNLALTRLTARLSGQLNELRHLSLADIGLTAANARELLSGLTAQPGFLEGLDLSGNAELAGCIPAPAPGAPPTGSLVGYLRESRALRHLVLQRCGLTPDSFQALSTAFLPAEAPGPRSLVEELDVSENPHLGRSDGANENAQAQANSSLLQATNALKNGGLRALDLSGCRLDPLLASTLLHYLGRSQADGPGIDALILGEATWPQASQAVFQTTAAQLQAQGRSTLRRLPTGQTVFTAAAASAAGAVQPHPAAVAAGAQPEPVAVPRELAVPRALLRLDDPLLAADAAPELPDAPACLEMFIGGAKLEETVSRVLSLDQFKLVKLASVRFLSLSGTSTFSDLLPCTLLRKFPNLTRLNLHLSNGPISLIDQLSDFCPNLTELTLINNNNTNTKLFPPSYIAWGYNNNICGMRPYSSIQMHQQALFERFLSGIGRLTALETLLNIALCVGSGEQFQMPAEGIGPFLRMLHQLRNLRHLAVYNLAPLSPANQEALIAALAPLETLGLCFAGGSLAPLLPELLSRNTNLASLELSGLANEEALAGPYPQLRHFKNNLKLIQDANGNLKGAFHDLHPLQTAFPQLEKLELQKEANTAMGFSSVTPWPSLRRLKLNGDCQNSNGISGPLQLGQILASLNHLEQLVLSCQDYPEAQTDYAPLARLTGLTKLCLKCSRYNGSFYISAVPQHLLQQLGMQMAQLRSLSLDCIESSLLQAISTHFRHLQALRIFHQNNFSYYPQHHIQLQPTETLQALGNHLLRLERLSLETSSWNHTGGLSAPFGAIQTFLEQNPQLRYLSFGKNISIDRPEFLEIPEGVEVYPVNTFEEPTYNWELD